MEASPVLPRAIIDEYYRRCIPLYLDFLGVHWHTGFYREGDAGVSSRDQVRMIDHIARLMNLGEQQRVLDVGCGIGATVCHLQQHWCCDVVGLTPVAEQKALALELASDRGISIQVDIGHAENLPYADACFDGVTFFESSCHFENRQAFFDEAMRVLKPGGRIAGEDWLALDLSNKDRLARWIEPICRAWAIPMLGDPAEYRQLMQNAGFADVEIVDLRDIMPLHRGFSVSDEALRELDSDIEACSNPLLGLTLKGLARLGEALNAGAFTIARITATKPGKFS